MHLGEAKLGDAFHATTQILATDEKRIRRLPSHASCAKAATVLATAEQMLLHVDMKAGRACPAPEPVLAKLAPLGAAHGTLEWPRNAGRAVGDSWALTHE